MQYITVSISMDKLVALPDHGYYYLKEKYNYIKFQNVYAYIMMIYCFYYYDKSRCTLRELLQHIIIYNKIVLFYFHFIIKNLKTL